MESGGYSFPFGMQLIKNLYGLSSFLGNQLNVLILKDRTKGV
jgi:hypothetical protein